MPVNQVISARSHLRRPASDPGSFGQPLRPVRSSERCCAFSILVHSEIAPVFAVLGKAGVASSPSRSATVPHGHYKADRAHARLGDAPDSRPTESRPSRGAEVVGIPRVGGLRRRYAWREAA
jgi:hypothetical protein